MAAFGTAALLAVVGVWRLKRWRWRLSWRIYRDKTILNREIKKLLIKDDNNLLENVKSSRKLITTMFFGCNIVIF